MYVYVSALLGPPALLTAVCVCVCVRVHTHAHALLVPFVGVFGFFRPCLLGPSVGVCLCVCVFQALPS